MSLRPGRSVDVVRDAQKPSIAVYFEHLFPESRGGGERLYGTLAQRWTEKGASVTYLTRSHAAVEPPVSKGVRGLENASAGGVYRGDGTRSPAGPSPSRWRPSGRHGAVALGRLRGRQLYSTAARVRRQSWNVSPPRTGDDRGLVGSVDPASVDRLPRNDPRTVGGVRAGRRSLGDTHCHLSLPAHGAPAQEDPTRTEGAGQPWAHRRLRSPPTRPPRPQPHRRTRSSSPG